MNVIEMCVCVYMYVYIYALLKIFKGLSDFNARSTCFSFMNLYMTCLILSS